MSEEPESLVVTTDTGDRIHYLDWGGPDDGGGPDDRLAPVLLIHDLGSTAWSWAPVARRLSTLTRVFAMDLRGHGLSDSPRTGYELESLAYDALTVLAANGRGIDVGGPPAAVVGHGFGAMVAATTADVQPGSISAVALVDSGWEEMADATGQSPAEFIAAVADPPEVLASMDAYLADRRDFDPATWDADQERAARAEVDQKYAGHVGSVVRPHALRGTVAAMFEFRPLDALARIAQPLLICVAESGSADDETIRERRLALEDVIARRAAAGLALPTIRRFPGAGHNLMRYRPAELSAEIAALFDQAAHQRS